MKFGDLMGDFRFEPATSMIAAAAVLAVVTCPAAAQVAARHFDIPPQPLPSALLEFSRQSDLLILVAPALTTGKRSKGVSAYLPADVALAQILEGTHLQGIPNPKGGYRVARIVAGRFLAAGRPRTAAGNASDDGQTVG
jgi:iron complex outermembrane receptor protein